MPLLRNKAEILWPFHTLSPNGSIFQNCSTRSQHDTDLEAARTPSTSISTRPTPDGLLEPHCCSHDPLSTGNHCLFSTSVISRMLYNGVVQYVKLWDWLLPAIIILWPLTQVAAMSLVVPLYG